MTDTPEMKPCPFCGKHLVKVEAFSTMRQEQYMHLVLNDDEDPCMILDVRVVVYLDDRQASGSSNLDAWNRRTIEKWREGFPPHPWDKEWFIAETIYGDRVVLTALPEEYTYDFKTADQTYIKRDNIKRWMQFPDSDFIPPTEGDDGNG